MKLTKEQLDTIKNAKTKEEAEKAYLKIQRPAFRELKRIEKPFFKEYVKATLPANQAYDAIVDPAYEAWINGKPQNQNYSKMTKAELIKLLKEKE